MIGFLNGEVIFSDGQETILLTEGGIGHQVFYNRVLAEGMWANLYIAHIVKEDSETLFGFNTLREKKLFELLLTVKGVGPKTAYNLLTHIGINEIITAVNLEDKKVLTQVPGLGGKGAAQIILDLAGKIDRVKMYSNANQLRSKRMSLGGADGALIQPNVYIENTDQETFLNIDNEKHSAFKQASNQASNQHEILNDTIMACKELGFREDKIIPLAQRILSAHLITKPEQLVHLVLKEL